MPMSQLTHGSFSSILSSLGQQALELQLERFFTVWAWTWDVDKDFNLCIDLGARMSPRHARTVVYPTPLPGLPLHSSYHSILPAIDDFSSQIPEGVAALVLTQSHVAPSSRYRSSQYPVALVRYLMNHLTPTPGPATSVSTTQPERLDDVSRGDHDDRPTVPNTEPLPSGGFLGVSISMSMDVRKWAWPSFGKGPQVKEMVTNPGDDVGSHCASGHAEAQVDQSALEDAISSDNSFGLPTEKPCALDGHEKLLAKLESDASEADTPRPSRVPSPTLDSSEAPLNSLPEVDSSTTANGEKTRFTWTDVFLAPRHELLATSRRRVYILKVSTDDVVTWHVFSSFLSAARMLLRCSATTRVTWMPGWNRPCACLKMSKGS